MGKKYGVRAVEVASEPSPKNGTKRNQTPEIEETEVVEVEDGEEEQEEEEVDLNDLIKETALELGATIEDFNLIKDLEDPEESDIEVDSTAGKDIDIDELKAFIASNFGSAAEQSQPKKKPAKKSNDKNVVTKNKVKKNIKENPVKKNMKRNKMRK